ncbi:hypothetical protein I4U23_012032 [Adineta vaga]|nr:hypothetical protein I4U23_012032 [Adineta vaga]
MFIKWQARLPVFIIMDEVENLARKIDQIDEKYKSILQDRSNPSWEAIVRKKDLVADRIGELLPTIPDTFPLSRYLLSSTFGYQLVAVKWIEFKKDPFHLNIEQTLLNYIPPDGTSRNHLRLKLLGMIESQIAFSICDIVEDSYWWRDVESKFFNSLSGMVKFRLCGLKIIRNKELFEKFNQYRTHLEENHQVLYVYHGSLPSSLRNIAKNGFLEAGKIKQLDPGYFGKGIYHGFAADYAIHYAEHYKKSNEIMLSMVLSGRSYVVKKGGEKYGKPCEPGFDSHISPEYREIVLFKSAQILPLFIIEFERVPNAAMAEEQY